MRSSATSIRTAGTAGRTARRAVATPIVGRRLKAAVYVSASPRSTTTARRVRSATAPRRAGGTRPIGGGGDRGNCAHARCAVPGSRERAAHGSVPGDAELPPIGRDHAGRRPSSGVMSTRQVSARAESRSGTKREALSVAASLNEDRAANEVVRSHRSAARSRPASERAGRTAPAAPKPNAESGRCSRRQ
jgi:hypothetical protein